MAIVATVTMGVMRPVLSKLCTLMGGEYKKLRGVETEVSFLEKELRAMHKLLENMDDTDELDPQAKDWRKDLIDMSYAIEDCIDDFMDRIGEASDKVGILKKATHFVRTFKDRYHKADEIKKIKNLVIEASKRRKSYMVDFTPSNASVVRVDPRLSAIYKDPSCLVGIESQKDELVKWVKDDAQQLKVMSIVGFGGSGKTTLANQVFQEVKGQFNCSGLVSVSQKPHITSLLNSLLLQLTLDQYSEACTQEILIINKLREHLQDKRYLLIAIRDFLFSQSNLLGPKLDYPLEAKQA
jgi:ATPase subunit of ABC transporter with duplicated ATPase domains